MARIPWVVAACRCRGLRVRRGSRRAHRDHDLHGRAGCSYAHPTRSAARATATRSRCRPARSSPSGATSTSTTARCALTGVPDTLDPASVQLRGIGEPIAVARAAVRARRDDRRRSARSATSARRSSVTTPKGDVTGTLRAADAQAIVIETRRRVARAASRRLRARRQARRRRGRRAAGAESGRSRASTPASSPSRSRIAPKDSSWTADYIAVFDSEREDGRLLGVGDREECDDRELRRGRAHAGRTPPRARRSARRVGPARADALHGARARAARRRRDRSGRARAAAARGEGPPGRDVRGDARSVGELPAIPGRRLQPAERAGRRRRPRRSRARASTRPASCPMARSGCSSADGARLDVVSEDQLHSAPNVARIRLASDSEIVGERRATSCNYDERDRTIHEKIELQLENHGKQRVDRDRARVHVALADVAPRRRRDPKGVRAAPQTQEYLASSSRPAASSSSLHRRLRVVKRAVLDVRSRRAMCAGQPVSPTTARHRGHALSRCRGRARAPRARSRSDGARVSLDVPADVTELDRRRSRGGLAISERPRTAARHRVARREAGRGWRVRSGDRRGRALACRAAPRST